MKEKTTSIDCISRYNAYLGCPTCHPLVSVVDLSKQTPEQPPCLTMGCYAVFLKEDAEGMERYGRKNYDFQDGMLTCFTPDCFMNPAKRACISRSEGMLLVLHDDWVQCSSLGKALSKYTFFSYKSSEALHLSAREKAVIVESISHIRTELNRYIDRFSSELIAKYVGVLLDYCLRFYERQFITRGDADGKVVRKMYRLIGDYFEGNAGGCSCRLPDAAYFAAHFGCSPAYLDDLLKVETGKSTEELVKCQRFEIAKQWLRQTDKSVADIAAKLGFCNAQYFAYLFKKLTGTAPQEFRHSC